VFTRNLRQTAAKIRDPSDGCSYRAAVRATTRPSRVEDSAVARTKSAFAKSAFVKSAKATAARVKPPSQTRARAIDGLLAQRERLAVEVAQLRKLDGTSAFVANAHQLLTRWWSRSSWSARAELLRNVEWLVRLEQHRDRREPLSS